MQLQPSLCDHARYVEAGELISFEHADVVAQKMVTGVWWVLANRTVDLPGFQR